MHYIILTIIIYLISLPDVYSATCSCAGIPLTDDMDQSGLSKSTYRIKFSYAFHDISDLIQGNTKINDETGRQRETGSFLFHFSYGITDKWSLTAVSSYIKHFRKINLNNNPEENSSGLGDSMLAVIYTPLKITPFSRSELAFGIAQKLDTGKSNNRIGDIVLIEDMQPGTGATGNLIWLYGARAFTTAANDIIFTSLSYTVNRKNNRDYRFGNEFNLAFGYNYESNGPWAYSLSLNYRQSDAHERIGFKVPNTGGQWLSFTPSLQYDFHERFAAKIGFKIPVARNLKGTLQFSSRYSLSLGFIYQWE